MKIAVFVDYWNFQLTLNEELSKVKKVPGYRAKVDWKSLGPVLAQEACGVLSVDPKTLSYEGCYIYTSYNPGTAEGCSIRSDANSRSRPNSCMMMVGSGASMRAI